MKVVVETMSKLQAQETQGSEGVNPGAPSQDIYNHENREDQEVNIYDKSTKKQFLRNIDLVVFCFPSSFILMPCRTCSQLYTYFCFVRHYHQ